MDHIWVDNFTPLSVEYSTPRCRMFSKTKIPSNSAQFSNVGKILFHMTLSTCKVFGIELELHQCRNSEFYRERRKQCTEWMDSLEAVG